MLPVDRPDGSLDASPPDAVGTAVVGAVTDDLARGARPAPTVSVVVPCFRERPNIAPLVRALEAALSGWRWEVVFVDDDSPDGTIEAIRELARTDDRVRGLRRVGRRGLSSAVIEGVLSSSAPLVAVMDADLQHDESRLPVMLQALLDGRCDVAVGSRHVEGGNASGLSSRWRHRLSEGGIRVAQALLPVRLGDPMSGFFACPRALFEQAAPRLSGQGFKILLDLILSAKPSPRVLEIPSPFRPRLAGESKLDLLVLVQFLFMLLDKATGGRMPSRFIAFALVGLVGVGINLAVLAVAHRAGMPFGPSQLAGTLAAMIANFGLNNSLTYRDRRLRGFRAWGGLVLFMLVCGVGAVANIGIARVLYETHHGWEPAGAAGAAIGVVWNYAVASTLIWRPR
ncbi:glycosyltransferase [Rhizosaccharibacter radicis]|uniref:Glycosyltransferase family 2 protein n=1 Tax=Rhizosaccharibacter radicis TaxID=2782605 RepID=A0ABT1VUA5_9PROT|nr:glycosyltransferase family 2 protein [Acetobacteraceae bacterium KSS12]